MWNQKHLSIKTASFFPPPHTMNWSHSRYFTCQLHYGFWLPIVCQWIDKKNEPHESSPKVKQKCLDCLLVVGCRIGHKSFLLCYFRQDNIKLKIHVRDVFCRDGFTCCHVVGSLSRTHTQEQTVHFGFFILFNSAHSWCSVVGFFMWDFEQTPCSYSIPRGLPAAVLSEPALQLSPAA